MPKDTSMQVVELLHGSTPSIDAAAILRRARELVPNVELLAPAKDGSTALFAHPMHVTHLEDGNLPAQTLLMPAHKPFARELQASDRAMLFHGVLQAVVEHTRPVALAFLHSQQIVSAADYLHDCRSESIYRRGSINVRFFRIEDSDDTIMDTRGLHELGLHDLQCHYRKLDPNDVGRVLRGVAAYIFENGLVIKAGETVEGLSESDKWQCQFEQAILPPHRELLDLNPGKQFAAGKRR